MAEEFTVLPANTVREHLLSLQEAIQQHLPINVKLTWRVEKHGTIQAGPWTTWRGKTSDEIERDHALLVFPEAQDPLTPRVETRTYFPQRRVEYAEIVLTPAPDAKMAGKAGKAAEPGAQAKRARAEHTEVTVLEGLKEAFTTLGDTWKGEGEKVTLVPNLKIPAEITQTAPLYPNLWLGRHDSWRTAIGDFLLSHGVQLKDELLVEYTRSREELSAWLETTTTPPTTKRGWFLPYSIIFLPHHSFL